MKWNQTSFIQLVIKEVSSQYLVGQKRRYQKARANHAVPTELFKIASYTSGHSCPLFLT